MLWPPVPPCTAFETGLACRDLVRIDDSSSWLMTGTRLIVIVSFFIYFTAIAESGKDERGGKEAQGNISFTRLFL